LWFKIENLSFFYSHF